MLMSRPARFPARRSASAAETGTSYAHDAGFLDPTTRARLRHDAVWRIYSMTKSIVSVATMVLVDRGVLRLDQAVADFIPAFAHLRVAQADGSQVPAEVMPTIQDLLRHTAGLAYAFLGDSPSQRAYVADGFLMEDLDNAEFVRAAIAALPAGASAGPRLALQPRDGCPWAAARSRDGQDLQGVLDETLFQPLGMSETGFLLAEVDRARVAQPFPQKPAERPIFYDPCKPRRGQRGNHGLVSTVDDQARFLRMMLCGGRFEGRRVLSAAGVELATADHLGQSIVRSALLPAGFGLRFRLRLRGPARRRRGAVSRIRGATISGAASAGPTLGRPARGFFVLLMMQTSSAAQRLHYRSLSRALVYAALDD